MSDSLYGLGIAKNYSMLGLPDNAGMPGAGAWTKDGNVYIREDHYGGKFYVPANHFEQGNFLEFKDRATAEKANGMSFDEAKSLAPQEQAAQPGPDKGNSVLDSVPLPSDIRNADRQGGGIYRKGKRQKPDWVKQSEEQDGMSYSFDEANGRWIPSGSTSAQ